MLLEELRWRELNPPLAEEIIIRAENQLGHKFPKDVREFLRLYHGSYLDGLEAGHIIYYDDPVFAQPVPTSLSMILTLEGLDYPSILRIFQDEIFAPDIVPFAQDSAGNLFCLDYRTVTTEEEEAIPILFCGLDIGHFVYLAASFREFISLLEFE